MDRISTSTKAVDLFGAGKHGFKDGNLALGISPTDFNAAFFNDLQEELLTVIESNGITPTAGARNQIYLAIQAMIAGAAANDYKTSVRAATTASINLAAPGAAIDGVAMAANDRFLDKDNATAYLRGIYIWNGAAVPATRATDADGVGELTSGAIVAVEEGATNADSQWMLATNGTITIGTTALTFTKQGSQTAAQIISQPNPTLAANAMTLPASTLTLAFRSATLGDGTVANPITGTVAALTIPAGATLGLPSGVLGSVYEIVMNNGGTMERAVTAGQGIDLSETGLISTTAISAAATAANVVYSQTARTNLPYRVVRRIDSTQVTAGQWATNPSLIQGVGGQALAAMSSMGYGQKRQDVLASRAAGTTYYNLTGKPITVNIEVTGFPNLNAGLAVNGITMPTTVTGGSGYSQSAALKELVMPGESYALTVSVGTLTKWIETR